MDNKTSTTWWVISERLDLTSKNVLKLMKPKNRFPSVITVNWKILAKISLVM